MQHVFGDILTNCTATLQGNCCGLSIYLKLLHSAGRIRCCCLHHDPGLLLGQGGSLSSEGGLLAGELTCSWWHPVAAIVCLLWHPIGSSCCSRQLNPSRQRPEKDKLFLEAASYWMMAMSPHEFVLQLLACLLFTAII